MGWFQGLKDTPKGRASAGLLKSSPEEFTHFGPVPGLRRGLCSQAGRTPVLGPASGPSV